MRSFIKILFAGLVSCLLLACASHSSDNAGEGASQVTHFNAAEAKSFLAQTPDAIVLDVRTRGEYEKGHIKGATQINYLNPSFGGKLKELDRSAPYLVHCRSGHRSGKVVKLMQREGFENIYHLDGGYLAWAALK